MQIHFISLGCDKNLVDSEVMLALLDRGGHAVTQEPELADAIIVNTCAFIEDATQEAIDTALEMSAYKEGGRCKALILTGCMAQRYRDSILAELPEVDAIVGTGDFDAIEDVLERAVGGERVAHVTDKRRPDNADSLTRRISATPRHYAYLKIAEGCDNRCTYCTIPDIRGSYVSRSVPSLLEEARALVDGGAREIVLVAQDTACYGKDIAGGGVTLAALLRDLARIDGVRWLRILYAYPENISDELVAEMAANPKVLHYIDIPMQHADDGVLRKMGRASSRAALTHTVAKLRRAMPDICLRSTFITGFPGETDGQFENLLSFVREIRLDKLGVFEYSREDSTPAAKMPDQIEPRVKALRKERIMMLQQDISREKLAVKVGQTIDVIVEGFAPDEGVYTGRTAMDAPGVDGEIRLTSGTELVPGDIVSVRVTGSSEYDLEGSIVGMI
ncbi:MAG: 30S ribosomal protein S12 methylthiotransferase RimO [Defluviitaleaceae bacterium]|nr:30S ribosomal protein S12 methylthiotransferase RimO [Defluviitaleaceae bacterium]